VPEASEHAEPTTSGVYIIFDIGITWRRMSASVREVLSDHLIIHYMKSPFKISNILSDSVYLTVSNSNMKCSTSAVNVKIFTTQSSIGS